MANDEHDNRQTDDEMRDRLLAQAEADHPGASIDLRTGPHAAQILLNRPALLDLIKKLQVVIDMSLSTTNVMITFANVNDITVLSIETDDQTTPN